MHLIHFIVKLIQLHLRGIQFLVDMIFYQQETLVGLILASIPAVLSVYFFFYQGE